MRRQGTEYGRNQAGWLVGRSVKAVFAVGCLHNSSAAMRLMPFSHFASAGEGQLSLWQGPRAMPAVPDALGTPAESALDVLPALPGSSR